MFNLFISDYKMLQTASGTECYPVPLNTGKFCFICEYPMVLLYTVHTYYILFIHTCMYIQRRETH